MFSVFGARDRGTVSVAACVTVRGERECKYTHTHTYTHTYIYIYIQSFYHDQSLKLGLS